MEQEIVEVEGITASLADMNLTIGDQIAKLSKRLNNINEELQQQVRDRYGALLQQATHAGRFDAALNTLTDDVALICNSSYRIKNQIDQQYQNISNQAKVWHVCIELSHLLRCSKTLLTLTTKLKNTKDVLKQAELHFELKELIEDSDLKKLNLFRMLEHM
ncbi:Conserved oligomeric Golgi complex subunit 5 [Eumeta japonica]|uniref:Conserved oligomeric Golgi complex subunit 5 n=1 Tax=Eumeta variegata TaxID=151549 RepID=A0A4C1TQL1_EUMVA|nr:Conserved oligomeric Golgi complex subunit 5 [Eumeta japonica]